MQRLLDVYQKYHPTPKTERIQKAHELAEMAYFGEKRLNGEDWLNYAIDVANVAADLRLDTSSICASLLLDAYKFGLTEEDVRKELGDDVAGMLTHLEHIRLLSNKYNSSNLTKDYADYIRRLILMTGKDVRVVALRLIQKLHALDSIYVFDKDHKEFMLKKAFEVYSPLADLIGMGMLHGMLSNKSFEIADPEKFMMSKNLLSTHFYSKDYRIQSFVEKLKSTLSDHEIKDFHIYGRTKSPYSFYQKSVRHLLKQQKDFRSAAETVYDRVAFRVIVSDIEECYKATDIIRSNFAHLHEFTDDYIKTPKPNGYQSIHLVIDFGNKNFGEIQIRTKEMHEYNEYGPASHVFYKLSQDKKPVTDFRIKLVQSLLQWQDTIFTESKNTAISEFSDEVLVFTPKGDVVSLDKGSTPIDFAYSLHTGLGTTAVKAKANGKLVPMSYILQSGDVVEIITDKNKKYPSEEWLEFAHTKRARISIKKVFASKLREMRKDY